MVENTLADWSKALLGGFVGAAIVFCLQIWLEWYASRKRTKGRFAALRAEIEECGRIASAYLEEKTPKVSLYRLPIICFPVTFAGLLEAKVLSGAQSGALMKFYAEVETMNRGLDLIDTKQRAAANQEGSAQAVRDEIARIHLKAKRIAAPNGELFISALQSVGNR